MKYYTQKELIELFRIARTTLYRATISGNLPVAKKDGRLNLYSEEDVIRYLEKSRKAKKQNN